MELKQIALNEVRPNPFQPREKFDESELQDLADNIKEHGLIEPIVVTKRGQKYMVVAGERRWRAHKKAGMSTVMAVVKDYKDDASIRRDSLIENELREDLKASEFKTFVYSLAKSLGSEYYKKGWVDTAKLANYILGLRSPNDKGSPLRERLIQLQKVQKYGVSGLKTLVSNDKINLKTASQIAGVKDREAQIALVNIAKETLKEGRVASKDIERKVHTHNFEQEAKAVHEKIRSESDPSRAHNTQVAIVNKFIAKIDGWNASLDMLVGHTLKTRNVFKDFSHENKLILLDNLKPLKRELEKSLMLITKLMEVLVK